MLKLSEDENKQNRQLNEYELKLKTTENKKEIELIKQKHL